MKRHTNHTGTNTEAVSTHRAWNSHRLNARRAFDPRVDTTVERCREEVLQMRASRRIDQRHNPAWRGCPRELLRAMGAARTSRTTPTERNGQVLLRPGVHHAVQFGTDAVTLVGLHQAKHAALFYRKLARLGNQPVLDSGRDVWVYQTFRNGVDDRGRIQTHELEQRVDEIVDVLLATHKVGCGRSVGGLCVPTGVERGVDHTQSRVGIRFVAVGHGPEQSPKGADNVPIPQPRDGGVRSRADRNSKGPKTSCHEVTQDKPAEVRARVKALRGGKTMTSPNGHTHTPRPHHVPAVRRSGSNSRP